jgi:hypothetical protein
VEIEIFILHFSYFIEVMKKRIPSLNLFSQPLSSFWTISLLEEVTPDVSNNNSNNNKNRKLYSPSVRVDTNSKNNTSGGNNNTVTFVSDLVEDSEKKLVEDSKNLYHQNLSRPKRVKVNKGQIKSTNKNELPPLQKYSGTGKEEKKKKKESFAYLKVDHIPISIPVGFSLLTLVRSRMLKLSFLHMVKLRKVWIMWRNQTLILFISS